MWRCFMLEREAIAQRWLRVYRFAEPVEGCEFHQAMARIGDDRYPLTDEGYIDGTDTSEISPDDPRWPRICSRCGASLDDGIRSISHEPFYRATAGDARYPMAEIPIGGMIEAHWERDEHWVGPDGRCYQVKLPPGGAHDWWTIDGPASGRNGDGRLVWHAWQRSGIPPDLSVTPSIAAPGYHGFLGSNGTPPGWLSDPL